MKTKNRMIVLLACLALVGISVFSYAAIINSTDTTKNVSTSNLDIELVQISEGGNVIKSNEGVMGFDYGKVVPGTTIDEKVAIKAADNSKSAYVRVTVNRYWQKDGVKDSGQVIEPSAIELTSGNDKNWIMIEDQKDSEVVYFYYCLPLNAGDISSNLIEGFKIIPGINGNSNQYSGYSSHIDFFAEGVQVVAGKEAMLAEWGVNATIDDNNVITSIVEQ